MSKAYELLMGLPESDFEQLRKVYDTEGREKAIELLTPKFGPESNEIVSELDRLDNFSKKKEVAEEEQEQEIQESGEEQVEPQYINIAEEGQEAHFVPNPNLPPTVGTTPVINTNILQDPMLKANDIHDGMQAGQATGAQIAMNRINDMKIQQFSKPIFSYTDALDLIRESYIKDLKKEVFDEMLSAYTSKSETSNGETEVTSVLSKYELPIEGADGIVDILSKIKEDSDNFGSSGRKVVFIRKGDNFSMSRGKRVVLINNFSLSSVWKNADEEAKGNVKAIAATGLGVAGLHAYKEHLKEEGKDAILRAEEFKAGRPFTESEINAKYGFGSKEYRINEKTGEILKNGGKHWQKLSEEEIARRKAHEVEIALAKKKNIFTEASIVKDAEKAKLGYKLYNKGASGLITAGGHALKKLALPGLAGGIILSELSNSNDD